MDQDNTIDRDQDSPPQPTVLVVAKWPGRCPQCSTRWEPGETITRDDEYSPWRHQGCPETMSEDTVLSHRKAAQAYGELCQECFLYHRGECA